MVEKKDIAAELAGRIQADIDHHGGSMPERTAVSWRGYLAAMLEWHVIEVWHYDELLARVPAVDNDPAIDILRGREDAPETAS